MSSECFRKSSAIVEYTKAIDDSYYSENQKIGEYDWTTL